MTRTKELFKKDVFEARISRLFDYRDMPVGRITRLMEPNFISCNGEDRTITIEYPVIEWQQNYSNSMHGGIIATAFDEVLGNFAYYASSEKSVVTVNISVN